MQTFLAKSGRMVWEIHVPMYVRCSSVIFTESLSQSKHKPRHRQVRGDGSPSSIHIRRRLYAVGGSPDNGKLCVKLQECRKTHNQDSPFDRHGILPLSNLHRRTCYELRVEDLLSEVQSEPTLRGIQGHLPYLDYKDHAPESTSSYSS